MASADVIVPPIVVVEGLDVSFFRTTEAVEDHFEAWFPALAEHHAFDSEGRALELAPRGSETVLIARDVEPAHAGELIDLLRDWLPMAGAPVADVEQLSLAELVTHALVLEGYTG
jgi:hypothetical protein